MICFKYKLNNGHGPAGVLPVHSATGYTHGEWYYGAAIIDNLDILANWQGVEVDMKTWTGRNPNPPFEDNTDPDPILACIMEPLIRDAYGDGSPLLQDIYWEPLVPYPSDGADYVWGEDTTSWISET